MIDEDRKKFQSDEVFHKICREVALNKKEINESNQILRNFILDILIPNMKKNDETFAKIFRQVKFVGSFYKKLKIDKPDEYDLNLEIKLPINYDNLEIDVNHNYYGYAKIKVNQSTNESVSNEDEKLLSKLIVNGYLDQDKFRNWFQGIMAKGLNEYRNSPDRYLYTSRQKIIYKIKFNTHNPAFTLTISNCGKDISFDLVPCLQFANKVLGDYYRPNELKTFITIAKPIRSNDIHANFQWRLGFYDDEKKIIVGHIKPIIKAVKKFVSTQNFNGIKSFAVETLFLEKLSDTSFRETYESYSRTYLLVMFLKQLHQRLVDKELLDFWDKRLNLFKSIPCDYAIRLGYIIDDINKNPKNLSNYFNLTNKSKN